MWGEVDGGIDERENGMMVPVLPTGTVMLEMRVVDEFVTWIMTFRTSEEEEESFEDAVNGVPTSYVTFASMMKEPSVSLERRAESVVGRNEKRFKAYS